MLAPVLLALSLGQGCPEPLRPSDPPPCAAMNVAGCLPGYVASRDERGRRIYVCDPRYYGPREEARPAPPPDDEPGYDAPDRHPGDRDRYPADRDRYPRDRDGYARPAPPPPAHAPAPLAFRSPDRGRLALVLMPGATSELSGPARDEVDQEYGAVGLELRGRTGGARVRFAMQFAEFGRIGELTLKYDFFDDGPVRPFLGLGVGAAKVDPLHDDTGTLVSDAEWRACGSIVGGVDLYLTPNVFFTLELQGRRFADRSDGTGDGLEVNDLRQQAALVGIGFYL
jgi:hypothetical protein